MLYNINVEGVNLLMLLKSTAKFDIMVRICQCPILSYSLSIINFNTINIASIMCYSDFSYNA